MGAAYDRLNLFVFKSAGDGFRQKFCESCHGIGFCLIIILAEGNKIDVFGIQEDSDVFHVHAQGIVGGKGEHQRLVIAQVGFGSHQHRRIGNPIGQFGQGISGTGGNNKNIHQSFWTDRFCPRNGGNRIFSGEVFCPLQKRSAVTESGIQVRGVLGKYRNQVGACFF